MLVTGGSGRVGKALVNLLLENGFEVHSLDIAEPDFTADKFTFFKGSVACWEDVERASRNCRVVFHVASKIELYPLCSEELWGINVHGTQNVVNACLEHGIANLIYTSTLDVTWTWDGVKGVETQNYPKSPANGYIKSKIAAEQLVVNSNGLKTSKGNFLKTCCLRPVHIYGPGDMLALSAVELGQSGFVPSWPSGDCCFVYVENVAYAHFLAAQKLMALDDYQPDSHGADRIYYIKDDLRTNYLEMIYLFAMRKNKKVRQLKVPYSLVLLLGLLATFFYWLFYFIGIQTEYKFSYWHVKILSGYECVDNSRSISDLGYVQRVSTQQGLRETWEWIDQL